MSKTREYTGTCYIGVSGSEIASVESMKSIERIQRRNGDGDIKQTLATKGYESRQEHINKFLDTHHDFLLFLDADMIFPAFTLERLRSHKLPYVSGIYTRRQFAPMALIWFRPFTGKFPYMPWVGMPERGKLHKLGASGWGCILVHREVILAVRDLLQGEWEVIEDDMDVWPYDLGEIMRAIQAMRLLVDSPPPLPNLIPALDKHTKTLEEQIRPLRAVKDIIGSDLRFPFFAYQAGYQLWGDPEVACGHNILYPLSPKDYEMAGENYHVEQQKQMSNHAKNERKKLRDAIGALND